jgi:hypothetical protein
MGAGGVRRRPGEHRQAAMVIVTHLRRVMCSI